MANLKDVIYISNDDYTTLVSNGTVTIDGTTLTYDENNLYITPEELATATQDGLMSAGDKVKLNSIDANAQVNVIESIKVNGTALTPSSKAVNVIVDYMTSTTWSTLKTLRDNSGLQPGRKYRITDYSFTTTQTDTSSAGHVFDIIVTADTVNKLNENAFATLHAGDTYFANCKLESWKLKYCLDNDTSRFQWADTTNGKGVIYALEDEFGNFAYFDFKNALFRRYARKNLSWDAAMANPAAVNCWTSLFASPTRSLTYGVVYVAYDFQENPFEFDDPAGAQIDPNGSYVYLDDADWVGEPTIVCEVDTSDYLDCYLFSSATGSVVDLSVTTSDIINNKVVYFPNSIYGLHNNVFFGNAKNNFINEISSSGGNTLENSVDVNIDAGAWSNTICNSSAITLSRGDYGTVIKGSSNIRFLSVACRDNIIISSTDILIDGQDIRNVGICNSCNNIRIYGNSYNISIKDHCENIFIDSGGTISLGSYSENIIFNFSCINISIGSSFTSTIDYCRNITFDSGCEMIRLICSDTVASSSNYLQNIDVHKGIKGSSGSVLTLTVAHRNQGFLTEYKRNDSVEILTVS